MLSRTVMILIMSTVLYYSFLLFFYLMGVTILLFISLLLGLLCDLNGIPEIHDCGPLQLWFDATRWIYDGVDNNRNVVFIACVIITTNAYCETLASIER